MAWSCHSIPLLRRWAAPSAPRATRGPEGPWAAAVFYANTGFALYFLSSPTSRHGRNIGGNAKAAATIQEDYSDWREIKGIQL